MAAMIGRPQSIHAVIIATDIDFVTIEGSLPAMLRTRLQRCSTAGRFASILTRRSSQSEDGSRFGFPNMGGTATFPGFMIDFIQVSKRFGAQEVLERLLLVRRFRLLFFGFRLFLRLGARVRGPRGDREDGEGEEGVFAPGHPAEPTRSHRPAAALATKKCVPCVVDAWISRRRRTNAHRRARRTDLPTGRPMSRRHTDAKVPRAWPALGEGKAENSVGAAIA